MRSIIKTELYKMKHYSIPFIGVALMLLSVLLTIFTSMANDGSVWDFTYFTEQVIKNNMTTFFPACITLIMGYLITREQRDDTLKSILTVPVSFRKLLTGKLIVGSILSLIFGAVCTVFTIVFNFIAGFPGFTLQLALRGLIQITLVNLLLYIAVMPIIIITSKAQSGFLVGVIFAFAYGYGGMFAAGSEFLYNIYPITAALGMVRYRACDPAVRWNTPLCAFSLGLTLLLSVILILATDNKMEIKRPAKKHVKAVPKKGW